MKASNNRLIAVDGLRGIAAICVALMHAKISWTPVLRGYLAVDFFFILSGYVIARGYEPRFAGGMSVREYAWLRVERLYPLLAIGSALGVGLWMLGLSEFVPVSEADRIRALIGQFTMVPYTNLR